MVDLYADTITTDICLDIKAIHLLLLILVNSLLVLVTYEPFCNSVSKAMHVGFISRIYLHSELVPICLASLSLSTHNIWLRDANAVLADLSALPNYLVSKQ